MEQNTGTSFIDDTASQAARPVEGPTLNDLPRTISQKTRITPQEKHDTLWLGTMLSLKHWVDQMVKAATQKYNTHYNHPIGYVNDGIILKVLAYANMLDELRDEHYVLSKRPYPNGTVPEEYILYNSNVWQPPAEEHGVDVDDEQDK